MPSLLFAALPVALLSIAACSGTSSEAATGGPVSIAVQQALTGQTTSAGTFRMSGSFADEGVTTEELTFGGPLDASPVPVTFVRRLEGRDGVLVVKGSATLTFSSPTAATIAGTWRVESATGKYLAFVGSGTLTGNANFGVTPPTGSLTYSGNITK